MLQRGEDVAKARRVEANVLATVDQLEVCLPVFKMYQKLQDQLSQKRLGFGLNLLRNDISGQSCIWDSCVFVCLGITQL